MVGKIKEEQSIICKTRNVSEFMKGIGNVSYEDQIKEQVEALRKSNLYRDHETLKNYVENTWLSCAYRWVQAFHKQQANNIVNTKNKIEA